MSICRPVVQIAAVAFLGLIMSACSTGPKVNGKTTEPSNIAPVTGAQVPVGSAVDFVWTNPENATHFDFLLYDRTDGSLGGNRVDLRASDICFEGQCSITETVTLPIHPGHAWRVRAKNYLGISSYSRTHFDVVSGVAITGKSSAGVPQVPQLVYPKAGVAVKGSGKTRFAWRVDNSAVVFDFHIYNAIDGSYVYRYTDVPTNKTCKSNACVLSVDLNLPSSDAHYWNVRAGNGAGKSGWSKSRFVFRR